MDVDGMTVEEMETFANDNGIPALLDHLGLDGLASEVVALYTVAKAARSVLAMTETLVAVSNWGDARYLRRTLNALNSKE